MSSPSGHIVRPSARRAVTSALFLLFFFILGTPSEAQDIVDVGSALISPGATASFPVHLLNGGAASSIAGIQLDITYDSTNTPIAAKGDGTPDCTVNSAIDKNATAFAFLPRGCSDAACNRVRAIVLDFGNVAPIPMDTLLFSCKVTVPTSTEAGNYLLPITEAYASSPSGQLVSIAMSDGFISVPVPGGGGC